MRAVGEPDDVVVVLRLEDGFTRMLGRSAPSHVYADLEAKHAFKSCHSARDGLAEALLARDGCPGTEHAGHGIACHPYVGGYKTVGFTCAASGDVSLVTGTHVDGLLLESVEVDLMGKHRESGLRGGERMKMRGRNPTWATGRRGMAEKKCCLFLFDVSG